VKQLSGATLFVVAIICGLIAAGLTVFYMEQIESKYRQAAQPPKLETKRVVMVRKNMLKGEKLREADIGALAIPVKFLPSNVVLAEDYKKAINRTLMLPVEGGRPMTWDLLTGVDTDTFSDIIEHGRRAKSIKIKKIDSFDGLLRPGDIIDIMGTFDMADLGMPMSSGNRGSTNVVMPVLERVEVLEAARVDINGTRYELLPNKNSADGINLDFTLITLNLSPRQVARVEMANITGQIYAVLRNTLDTSTANYEYLGVELLREAAAAELIDIVLDANGNPLGRVIGDNIVDDEGNIIGNIIDGKAVGLDGKSLGRIVENVSPDDAINRVDKIADVVRDEDGNIIGILINGEVVDKAGNVIGTMKDGKPVGANGQSLGTIERGVALDKDGRAVDINNSRTASGDSRRGKVVRDSNGNVVGRVVNGQVIDSSGRVIGKIGKNGSAVGIDGKSLGTVEEVIVDRNGNVVGREQRVVRDADGNIVGRVVDGKVLDSSGNVVGVVDADGVARSSDGAKLGSVETVMVGKDGRITATVSEVVKDAEGNVIGRVVDGQVVDANGNVVGQIVNGRAVDSNGNVIGEVEKVVVGENGRELQSSLEVVRDAEGNIIGTVINGEVVDNAGNVIGRSVNGQILDGNGRVLYDNVSVTSEATNAVAAELRSVSRDRGIPKIRIVDFIPGGSAKDGITPVLKVRIE
jgi:Flp pilus assembly protein CpaB